MLTISMSAKCSDMFSMVVLNENREIKAEYDGYVPDFFPGEHYGDYVELEIDAATGQILNWPKNGAAKVAKFIKEQKKLQK